MLAPPRYPILIVEDNPADVFVMKEVLRENNLDAAVHVAHDGREAMLYLQSLVQDLDCPALVLLDLNLPSITGFEVLGYLKTFSVCKKTPVIIVTSSNVKVDREKTERLGAQAYFQKPSSLESYMQLGALIKQVMGVK